MMNKTIRISALMLLGTAAAASAQNDIKDNEFNPVNT